MKKAMMVMLCMLIWSSNVSAACVGTVTASTPTADFIDNGDGTVTHLKTGLMWKQCSEGLSGAGCTTGAATTHTWQGALQAAETLNAAGGFATYTDWRVPNSKELDSIVESQCFTPAINATIFPATVSNRYWSSSPYANDGVFAWDVGFGVGDDSMSNKSSVLHVRLVRSGQ